MTSYVGQTKRSIEIGAPFKDYLKSIKPKRITRTNFNFKPWLKIIKLLKNVKATRNLLLEK